MNLTNAVRIKKCTRDVSKTNERNVSGNTRFKMPRVPK